MTPPKKSVHLDLKKAVSITEGGILSKVLTGATSSEATVFAMAGGTSFSEHTSGREAHVVVLEGEGTFNLAGQEIPLFPGAYIFMEAGTAHSLTAKKNLLFLLILA